MRELVGKVAGCREFCASEAWKCADEPRCLRPVCKPGDPCAGLTKPQQMMGDIPPLGSVCGRASGLLVNVCDLYKERCMEMPGVLLPRNAWCLI